MRFCDPIGYVFRPNRGVFKYRVFKLTRGSGTGVGVYTQAGADLGILRGGGGSGPEFFGGGGGGLGSRSAGFSYTDNQKKQKNL